MKYLKTKNISKFSVSDKAFIVNPYGRITTNSKNSLQIPVGNDAQRPQTSLTREGQMRMNTQVGGAGFGLFEVFQAGEWRTVKFKTPTKVEYQTFPAQGNNIETIFGKLDPAPPTTIENGQPWTGAQIMVYVENVFQLYNTNYTIVQNPCDVTGTIISFTNPDTITSSNTGIINFVTQGFHTGQTITVTGSTSNNADFTVTNVSSSAITVSSGVTLESAGQTVRIQGKSTFTNAFYPTGYYIRFFEPVPSIGDLGNPGYVTVISGYDS
jgi:hypothetical protein